MDTFHLTYQSETAKSSFSGRTFKSAVENNDYLHIIYFTLYLYGWICRSDIGVFSHIQHVIVHIAVITTSLFVELREIIYNDLA